MSAIGRVVLEIQEALWNNQPREEIVRILRENYGFGEQSALEFIRTVENDMEWG